MTTLQVSMLHFTRHTCPNREEIGEFQHPLRFPLASHESKKNILPDPEKVKHGWKNPKIRILLVGFLPQKTRKNVQKFIGLGDEV
jgi:hypothetical protein